MIRHMRVLFRKIFPIALMVILIQTFTGVLYYPPELKKVMIGDNCANKIVFLGDSTIETFSHDDNDRRSIALFLEEKIKRPVVCIAHGGYHLGLYRAFVEYFTRNSRPETVIIPINMRTFSQEWDVKPGSQFDKESFLLTKGNIWTPIYKPVSIYTEFFNEGISKKAWYDMDVYDYDRYAGKVGDFENIGYKTVSPDKIRNKIIYHYRYKLLSNHRKLAALDAICKLANRNAIKVLFYITPLDIDYMEQACPGTETVIAKNIALVSAVIRRNNMAAVDLSHVLHSEDFSWSEDRYPNEHLNERGRKAVAGQLANVL